jgi:hypothetical protein
MKKKFMIIIFSAAILSLAISVVGAPSAKLAQHQNHSSEKQQAGHNHSQHHAEMNKRGDKAMGFSHEKTTHHFRLLKDGGVIEVTVKEVTDAKSLNQIRMHLSHIAQMFAEGNFSTPFQVHEELPTGAKTMAELKREIAYKFEEQEQGGRVLISSKNPQALAAIHQFLRYQIKEHQTGDSTNISNP